MAECGRLRSRLSRKRVDFTDHAHVCRNTSIVASLHGQFRTHTGGFATGRNQIDQAGQRGLSPTLERHSTTSGMEKREDLTRASKIRRRRVVHYNGYTSPKQKGAERSDTLQWIHTGDELPAKCLHHHRMPISAGFTYDGVELQQIQRAFIFSVARTFTAEIIAPACPHAATRRRDTGDKAITGITLLFECILPPFLPRRHQFPRS